LYRIGGSAALVRMTPGDPLPEGNIIAVPVERAVF
jgi:hypothetical protein